jgi:hypothetical protein
MARCMDGSAAPMGAQAESVPSQESAHDGMFSETAGFFSRFQFRIPGRGHCPSTTGRQGPVPGWAGRGAGHSPQCVRRLPDWAGKQCSIHVVTLEGAYINRIKVPAQGNNRQGSQGHSGGLRQRERPHQSGLKAPGRSMPPGPAPDDFRRPATGRMSRRATDSDSVDVYGE